MKIKKFKNLMLYFLISSITVATSMITVACSNDNKTKEINTNSNSENNKDLEKNLDTEAPKATSDNENQNATENQNTTENQNAKKKNVNKANRAAIELHTFYRSTRKHLRLNEETNLPSQSKYANWENIKLHPEIELILNNKHNISVTLVADSLITNDSEGKIVFELKLKREKETRTKTITLEGFRSLNKEALEQKIKSLNKTLTLKNQTTTLASNMNWEKLQKINILEKVKAFLSLSSDFEVTLATSQSLFSNDSEASLDLPLKLTKGETSKIFEIKLSGFQTESDLYQNKVNAIIAKFPATITLTNKIDTYPSELVDRDSSMTKYLKSIEQLAYLFAAEAGFEHFVDSDLANDHEGTLKITLVVTKGSAEAEKTITISNFKKLDRSSEARENAEN